VEINEHQVKIIAHLTKVKFSRIIYQFSALLNAMFFFTEKLSGTVEVDETYLSGSRTKKACPWRG
jgi:hypothetical protein